MTDTCLPYPFRARKNVRFGPQLQAARSILALILLALILVIPHRVQAEEYLSEAKRNDLLRLQHHLFNDQFVAAHNVADSLVARQPSDPVGYIFKAAICLGEMIDAEASLYPDLFDSLIETADSLAKDRISVATGRELAWMYLFRGHAAAYRSLYESRFGSFASALRLGLKVKSYYEDGLKADSSLYDLYGGLGMYHYWKSAKAGILRWLRIFKDDKQKGIDELRLTVDSSTVSSDVARNALIWIWLDREEYDSAIVACRVLLEEYPDGKMFRWPLAQALANKGEWHRALEVYETLREMILGSAGNYFNLIECDFNIYRCYDELGMSAEADRTALALEEYYDSIPGEIRNRQKGKIAFLRRAAKR